MVTSKQIVEKMRDYRRTFTRSWNLFRESRIGLIGLAIMIAFTVMAVAAPFMGLKHPVEWTAPSIDLLEAEPYFIAPPNITGEVKHDVGIRIVSRDVGETNNADDHMDRIYVGTANTVIAYSFNGYKRYTLPLTGQVTTAVNVINLGDTSSPAGEFHVIYAGCDDGSLNAFVDDVYERDASAAKNEMPASDETFRTVLDGPVSSDVAVMNVEFRPVGSSSIDYRSRDRVFVGTETGTVYCFDWNLDFVWSTSLGNSSVTSVAVTDKLGIVVAGTEDGLVYGIRIADGDTAWPNPYDVGTGISPIAIRNDGQRTFVGSHDGKLHVIDTLLGTAIPDWEGGFALTKTAGALDEGRLQKPAMNQDGSLVYVTSDSGYLYAVRTQNAPDERIQWNYYAAANMENAAQFIAPPVYDQLTLSIFAIADNYNGTPTDPSDDFSVLFRMSQDGIPDLNMTFAGVAHVSPKTCYVRNHGYVRGILAVSSNIGNGITTMYSYSAAGTYLAPLKPTWMTKDSAEDARDRPPTSGNYYWLGTDAQGRDILSQVIWGSRIALLVGFAAAAFSIGIGAIVGLVSGYYGGWVDAILMRFTDVILVLPSLPLLIIMAALLEPSIWNIVFIIGITGWGGPARMIRSQVLSLKERPFIDSARVTGASKMRIMFKHIAPNVLPLGLLYMTFYVGGAILSEASLAFIGLGDPRTMSWGMMLNFVQHSNALANWWWLIPPGLCITLVCMAFFLIGRAFDEIVNPRLRKR
ncbi:MAG: ABC transporter permease subunit [Methanobacteriota archaeon]